MEYDLSRIDYTICGITCPDTLKILPSVGSKPDQKIAVGDKNGVLQCLSIKDEEPVVQFKTLPGKPITSVQLTATMGTQADKIFTASSNEVKGYTRKGKVFLSLETALSETITSMCILGSDLILCSGKIVTFYRDLREYHSYICEDRVLDMAAFASPRVRILLLVANKGAIILENGKPIARTAIPSGPSRLAVPPISHVAEIYSLFGASDGSIGLIVYQENTLSSKFLVEGRGLGSVVCLGWFFNNIGVHLAVGRHDGAVQIYLIDVENLGETPRLKFTYFCGEPVTSVVGASLGGTEESALLVATFSGRIFALRPSHSVVGTKLPTEVLAARRARLEQEVAKLEKQTASERDKYQRNTRSLHAGLSTPPLLDIEHEVLGASKDGWQEVRITSAVPLDMLFICCNNNLNLQTDNAAVLSISSSKETGTALLASVRCQAGTRRVWVKMRNIMDIKEPSLGGTKVMIYVLPTGAPRVARLLSIKLPSLSHYSEHQEYEKYESQNQERIFGELQISGKFSVAEMTAWLNEALPGELPRPSTNITFARSHILLGTVLLCQYQRGFAVFKSDNISTLRTVSNIVSNSSVEKNIKVEISCEIPDDCCVRAFKSIKDIFKTEYQNNKDIILKNAISMLDLDSSMNEEGPVLCQEYTRIWDSRDNIQNSHFDEFVESIMQWYIDWRALSLNNGKFTNETSKLETNLKECNLENICKILSNSPLIEK